MRRSRGSQLRNASTTSGSNCFSASPTISATASSQLPEDRLWDADLADVVQEKAVLETRVVEERRLDRARELGGVATDALGVLRGTRVLRIERGRERGHGLSVRMLQQRALASLDLQESLQILR